MKEESYKRAKELRNEISALVEFITILNNGRCNVIEVRHHMDFIDRISESYVGESSFREIKNRITACLKQRIAELEKEFEEL